MTNHVHLLLSSPEVHLGILMRNINKRYSDYYRKRHNYIGQIYQNRYFSKEIPASIKLLSTSAYIHLNPIETKTPMVNKLQDYPYSSYPAYFYNKPNAYPFIRLDLLPSFLNQTKPSYAKWCLKQKEKQQVK